MAQRALTRVRIVNAALATHKPKRQQDGQRHKLQPRGIETTALELYGALHTLRAQRGRRAPAPHHARPAQHARSAVTTM